MAGSSADDAGIAVAPIMSIPAKDTHLPALNHHLRAVAIVFDFRESSACPLAADRPEASCGSMNLSRVVSIGFVLFASLIEEAPGRWMPGLLPLYERRRDMMMAREPSPQPNYLT